jgi:hypothetical protein
MQPSDDRHDDSQLRGLLREWQAPETPASLEQRVLGLLPSQPYQSPSQSWWRFLLNGYIRVPVSLVCTLVVLLTVGVWKFVARAPSPCAERAGLSQNRVGANLPPDRCDHPAPGVC